MAADLLALVAVCAISAPAGAAPGKDQFGPVLKRAQQFSELQVTEEEEIALGAAVSERVRERYGVVQDQAVHRYVSLVGSLIAAGEQPAEPRLALHRARHRRRQRLRGSRRVHSHHARRTGAGGQRGRAGGRARARD